MAICCLVRPPHALGGVANSRSLLVATPPLVLAPLEEVSKIFEIMNNGGLSGAIRPSIFYLTGQVVLAYRSRECIYSFPTRDFGSLASGPF
jgi:hypothetical protein